MIDINKISPQGDRCLVEPYKRSNRTESGIELAEQENEATPVMGVIRRAGEHSEFEAGQHILFRRYGIDELSITSGADKVTVYIIEDSEIIATIDNE